MDFGLGGLLSFDNLNGPLQFGYDIFNNERNYNLQKSQYHYQKNLNDLVMAREDNAVQRRVKDLRAAGFSPYLASGNAATTGTLSSSAAPQVHGVDLQGRMAQSLAMDQAHANIAKTNAEADAIKKNEELTNANLNLVNKTIQWYNDHPGFAPNVESGIYTGKGINSFIEGFANSGIGQRLSSAGESLGRWLYKKHIYLDSDAVPRQRKDISTVKYAFK